LLWPIFWRESGGRVKWGGEEARPSRIPVRARKCPTSTFIDFYWGILQEYPGITTALSQPHPIASPQPHIRPPHSIITSSPQDQHSITTASQQHYCSLKGTVQRKLRGVKLYISRFVLLCSVVASLCFCQEYSRYFEIHEKHFSAI
jgi:hypothetical protein